MKALKIFGGIIIMSIVIVILILPSAFCQDWGNVDDSEWLVTAPVDYPEANVLILFDIGKMEVKPDAILFHRHVRAKILNKAGIDEIGNITFSYHEDDNIKDLKAQTIDMKGKKYKVDKKKFFTKTSGHIKFKSFAFPSLDSGCIVEYQYTNSNDRYYSLDPWNFNAEYYTLKSRFNVVLWPGFDYTTAATNMSPTQQQAAVEKIANMDDPSYPLISYTWELDDLPPIKEEPYMSFVGNYVSSISSQIVSYQFRGGRKVEFIKSWKDLGQQVYEFIRSYVDGKHKGIDKDDVLTTLVDSLTAGLNNDMDKTRFLYDYVKNKIQEKASYSYFMNENLAELLDTRVGTGEEKNMLLVEMLKKANIPVWPVLIGSRDTHIFNPRIYHLDQFDNMIVKAEIGSDPVFMDASYKYYAFGTLPPESREFGGCQIEDNNSQVIKIDCNSPASTDKEHTLMHYNNDGTVSCSTSVNLEGYLAAWYAREYDESDPEKFIKDYFLDNLETSYELSSSNFEFDSTGSAILDFAYTLDDYVVQVDNNTLLTPVRFYFRENPFKSTKRFFPIDFNYPRRYSSMIEISSDSAFSEYTLPEAEQSSIPGGSYTNNCMFDGTRIVVVSNLFIDKPIIPQPLYETTRDFFDKVASSSRENVALIY